MSDHFLDSLDAAYTDRLEGHGLLAQIHGFDWSRTAAGDIQQWPASLQHAMRIMLLSAAPMAVFVGRQGLLIYNEAVREMFGEHYEGSLGKPVTEVLPEAAAFYQRALDTCFAGQGVRFRDAPLRLRRHGRTDVGWFNLAFTPIADERAQIHGVLLIANESTIRVRALRDLERSRDRLDIALQAGGIVGIWDLDIQNNQVITDARFARFYGVDPEQAGQGVDLSLLSDSVIDEDRERVVAALRQAGESGQDYKCEYRSIGIDGTVHWLVSSARPLMNENGIITHLCGVVIDITEQMQATAALNTSELRFKTLADTLPQNIFSADAQGRHVYFNSRWHEFTGHPQGPVHELDWIAYLHPQDHQLVMDAWQHSVRSGETYDIEYRYLHHSGQYRWMRVMAQPLRDEAGNVVHWFGAATDVHETRTLAMQRELVAKELDHRIKNLFAIVDGLIALTSREHPELKPLAAPLRARLGALHRAHGLLRVDTSASTEGPQSLQQLMNTVLEPYIQSRHGHVRVGGDDVQVHANAVTPLALVFHELATNAVKYGALRHAQGTLTILCRHQDEHLHIKWQESNPGEHHDMQEGFGSRLLSMAVEMQLRGQFQRHWAERGPIIDITLPLSALQSAAS